MQPSLLGRCWRSPGLYSAHHDRAVKEFSVGRRRRSHECQRAVRAQFTWHRWTRLRKGLHCASLRISSLPCGLPVPLLATNSATFPLFCTPSRTHLHLTAPNRRSPPQTAASLLGADMSLTAEPLMTGEDFAFFCRKVGCDPAVFTSYTTCVRHGTRMYAPCDAWSCCGKARPLLRASHTHPFAHALQMLARQYSTEAP